MGSLGSTLLALQVALGHQVRAPEGQAVVQVIPPLGPGAAGELSITILETPESGTPIELRLRVPEEIRIATNRLGWDDVVDTRAVQPRLRTRFTAPAEPGSFRVHGLLRYLSCDERTCVPKVVRVSWDVEVVLADPDAE